MNGLTKKHLSVNGVIAIISMVAGGAVTTFAFLRSIDQDISDNRQATELNRQANEAVVETIRQVADHHGSALEKVIANNQRAHEALWRNISETNDKVSRQYTEVQRELGEIRTETKAINKKLDRDE